MVMPQMFEVKVKKALPLTGREDPQGCETSRFPHLSTQSTHRWWYGWQPYVPAIPYPQEDSWYSFLLQAESTTGP
jgi:hypothetical protein